MKSLEHSQIDEADRKAIEEVVERYRINSIPRSDVIRNIVSLGFERECVERYMQLLDSTLEMEPVTPSFRTHAEQFNFRPSQSFARGRIELRESRPGHFEMIIRDRRP